VSVHIEYHLIPSFHKMSQTKEGISSSAGGLEQSEEGEVGNGTLKTF
jgi:hypothetical protein